MPVMSEFSPITHEEFIRASPPPMNQSSRHSAPILESPALDPKYLTQLLKEGKDESRGTGRVSLKMVVNHTNTGT
jgi:hypothetical protein